MNRVQVQVCTKVDVCTQTSRQLATTQQVQQLLQYVVVIVVVVKRSKTKTKRKTNNNNKRVVLPKKVKHPNICCTQTKKLKDKSQKKPRWAEPGPPIEEISPQPKFHSAKP